MKKRKINLFKKSKPFIFYEMMSLISASVAFVSASGLLNGWWQTVLISIGTGLFTSAIVSFSFWKIQKECEKRIADKRRNDFMKQFKILAYSIVQSKSINMFPCQNLTLDLCDYVKNQHRWFHNYWKRIDVNNYTENETALRTEQMTSFINNHAIKLKLLFDERVTWGEGNFSEWQLSELKGLYGYFCESKYYIENKNYKSAFLSFAWFFEIFMRIVTQDEFDELKHFNLIKFMYDELGNLSISEEEFDKKEPMIKFAKDFNKIRHENNKNLYGVKANGQT